MTRRTRTGNSPGYRWRSWGQLLPRPTQPARRSRRVNMRFELLEARRVMYGADFLEMAEGEAGSQVEEFSLTDVNPESAKFNQSVSPSDYLQKASAWYFGHST